MRGGADIVIAGRAADPSLFLAPLLERLGWDPADEDLVAAGTLVGHLLECAGQVSGGYFADPGVKGVPDLAHPGFPVAEVDGDGSAVITKLPGTGGRVDTMTVTEQLTYEVTDPSAYLTPDVSLDMRGVQLSQAGPDRVRVAWARGGARPDRLKASVGCRAGFRGEGEISYAGPGAAARARLAGEVVRERLGERVRTRVDLLGDTTGEGGECRLRVAGTSPDRAGAEAVEEEGTALYTCGPAGGGGARTRSTEVIGILSTTIGRDLVEPGITYVGKET
ncbi:acyclic terpene utilization AtuA family protein [Nocardiopsis kunsanensis]|uniref:acyclic terpene utilization AtuA family protein n=1 Tax=Nocardiopsis kunsanensis TaxID=141693 RepID=UPI001EF9D5E0|nr:acyclic terpene utilization AtuA family protein [Nocardiopsis kunsanensis]